MGILNDISKKAQEYAGIAVDKAKDLAEVAADKAQTLSDTAKTNMAIMNEQREMEKNYRAIGEWFVAEHQSDVPDAVKDVVAAVNASKERIAQLEELFFHCQRNLLTVNAPFFLISGKCTAMPFPSAQASRRTRGRADQA